MAHPVPPNFLTTFTPVELDGRVGVQPASIGAGRGPVPSKLSVSLRSLPACRAAISERFFSSSLPPSFARGRFATLFFAAAATIRGAALSLQTMAGAQRPIG